MTPHIQDIIEDAIDEGCDYCDIITLMLDDMSCCEYCPFNVENAEEQCVLTDIGAWIK